MSLTAIVIVGLAAYRVTRLFVTDQLSEPFRDRVIDWAWADPDAPVPRLRAGSWRSYIATLFTCPHCLGFWAALGGWLWWWYLPRWPVYVFAIAGVVTIVASVLAKLEE